MSKSFSPNVQIGGLKGVNTKELVE